MRKRLLACFLAFVMVLGMMPAAAFSTYAEETTVTPPFTTITTEDGEAVTYSYKGAIPASTSWASYEDGPYYHVTIPEGTEKVLVTYPADVGIAGAPSAFSYTLSVPGYELGYGSTYFAVTDNADGSHTVTIPVADYLLTDGTGTAMSLEAANTFDPITFFSFEYGAASCLSVAADAPTGGTIKVGDLYQVALDEVFADSQGHDLTYSFETAVTNQHTKIQENTFVFSAQEEGTYEVKLTATCGQATATHTLNITVEKASEGLEAQYNYDETDKSSVTVYVTMSNDGMPIQGDDGTVMAHLEVTVPYFDLSLYGLEKYNRYGTENGQGPYVNDTVIKRPTGLHLYIYLLERYYLGLPENQCCLGTSGVLDISDHTDVFYMNGERAYTSSAKAIEVSGLATSLFLFNFWGHDCNLMYFRNHCYPYMSAGWGATADYILLSDGDSWDVGLFTNWQFNTTGGFFACFDKDDYTANPGEELTVSTLYWGTTSSSGDFEEKTGLNVQLYNSDWEYVQSLSYNEGTNSLTFTAPEEAGEYYLLALEPNATDTVLAKGAPAAAKLIVGSSGSVDISSYYDDYDFISVKDDQGRYLVDIKGYTVSTNENGDVPAHQITVEEGTETVYVTYPAEKSFVVYTGKYSVEDAAESGYGKSVTLTTNDDGTITVAIPIAKYLDTGNGILLENSNYKMTCGFDFVTGTITKVEVGSDVAASRILLNSYEKTLVYNSETENTFQIAATVLPAEATGWTIQWTSSNEAVAKVDEKGLVTAVGEGDAVITAAIGDITASCTIHAQRYNTAPKVDSQAVNHTKVTTGTTVTLNDVSAYFTDDQGDELNFTAKVCTPASVEMGYEYSYSDGEAVAIGEDGACSYTFDNTGVYALKITASDGLLETSFYYQVTVVPNDSGKVAIGDGMTLDIFNVAVVGHSEELVEDFEIPYKGTHDTIVHHIVLSKSTIEGNPYRKMDVQVAEGYGWCEYDSMTPGQSTYWQTRADIGLFAADLEGNLTAHFLQFHTECEEHTDENDDGVCDVCTLVLRESVNALAALSFHSTYSANDTDYTMIPAFDPAVKEYTLVAHDSKNACYAKATLAEGVEGTITAAWLNWNTDESRTATLTSSSKSLTGAVKTGNYNNTVVVTVADGDDNVVDSYTVNIVRTPSLTGLALEGMKLNETFLTTTTAYTASTAADSVTVTATPRDESYTVTINGGEDATVALEMGENLITVVVKNDDGYETAYTITVTRKESITVSFEVNAENPRITLKDANNTAIVPVDGVYTLISGETYSYTVQCDGYIGQTNSFSLEESGVIEIVLEKATENPDLDKTIYAQWANFRNGPNHLGITSAATPYDPEDAELLWAVKYGTGWSAAPGSPIIVDGDIITYIGSSIKRLDRNTGAILAEGTMVGSSSYSIVPATYADGMIFVGLSGGRIQCFNAKTLESLWVYTDELKGQPNCPITYKDGYIYAGFWNSETRDANFVCIYTIDEDHENTTEAKLASWTYTRAGGFYWAGAYVSDKFAVVGTDDGASGYTTEGASLLVFDRLTGEIVDSYDGLRGDIRSNVSYDPSSDRVFFTSKGGILCNAKVDWETGKISDFHQTVIQDANGNANAMSTCTPSVYNGRIYIGICGTSQFGDNSGHGIAVYDLNADGSMTQAYVYAIKGYPQTSAMVTTAYADEEGYVYIYLPYNSTPGGISVLKDKKGQTEPLTTTDSGYSEVFTPVSPLSQYCICSTVADEYGTIYYKNDSCYMMAITSKIEALELTGTPSDTGFKAETRQHNGTTRDVTDYVEITQDADAGTYAVSYTYGFDNDNYGLKTLTVYSVTLPEGEGYTVTGDATAAGGESYTFTLNVLATYEKTDAFAVKVNGETLSANEDGTYTVEEVSESLIITVEGVEEKSIDITVYYADNGTIVTGKDGTVLNFAPVTVTDANGDGQFTMYDGFYCFHEQYHANGAAGYTDSNWVTQFWSVDTAMVSYGRNNRWVFSTADEITDGDSLCLFTYQDQYTFSDLYTYFDNLTATATISEETSFHVNGYSFFGSGSNMDAIANPVGATVTATCGDKILTTTTDAEGNFKLTFPSAGEWTILVNGKCSYTCDVGYYKGQTYTDAPVTPAMMTVTVEAPTYTITLSEDKSFTISPCTGYTTSVKEGESFKFFVTTAVGYQKGENFTVKANGQTLTPNGTVYTLENVTANVTITVEGVEAIVCEPVTVYFSISEDDQFQIGKESEEVMALRKITVPYFDLGLYGLEDFYFSSETYSSDGGEHSSDLLPGTAEYAYGKVTLLHLYIYALEVYYCGIDESLAGQGYLYEQNLLGTEVLTISGSSGSLFMNDFWGMDLNLNYYVNYEYPLASEGWGSTSDQILLRENDVITLGHFTSWSFFNDPDSIFNYLTPDEDNKVYGSTTVTQGDKLTLTGYHAGADMSGDYTTAHTKLTSEPTIYYALYDDEEQDFSQWTVLGNLSADGTIVFDTTNLAPGTYVVAMAGMYGSDYTEEICSTPGGILVVVEEKDTIPGDLNGDGKITTVDASMVQMYLKGKTTLTEEQLAAADVNGDGKVTAVDFALMKMYIQNKLESFPKAQ